MNYKNLINICHEANAVLKQEIKAAINDPENHPENKDYWKQQRKINIIKHQVKNWMAWIMKTYKHKVKWTQSK